MIADRVPGIFAVFTKLERANSSIFVARKTPKSTINTSSDVDFDLIGEFYGFFYVLKHIGLVRYAV